MPGHTSDVKQGLPVLSLSFAALSAASALGAYLAILVMRTDSVRPPWRIAAVHGGLGGAGLAVLVFALWGAAPRGVAEGVSVFGWDAVALLGAAFLAGLGVWGLRGRSGLVIALHAILAMFGYVILAAYVSLG